jgi:hypothetical protein
MAGDRRIARQAPDEQVKAPGLRTDDCAMSQPYEFFPGSTPESAAAFGQPASPNASAFGQPTSPYASAFGQPAPPYAAGVASVAPLTAPARPGTVSVLAGLLVAQAALAAAPAVVLLLLRDVIGTAMRALTSGFGGADELTGAGTATGMSGTGRLTLWGVALLLVTVASALSAVAVLDRRVWALVAAGVTEVGLLIWGLAHFGSVATVSTLAVLLAVAIGGLLAAPDVRRWCLSA